MDKDYFQAGVVSRSHHAAVISSYASYREATYHTVPLTRRAASNIITLIEHLTCCSVRPVLRSAWTSEVASCVPLRPSVSAQRSSIALNTQS